MPKEHPEEALHEQREWLRVTLSSIGDAVITTDARGRVTFLNPVAQSLTGWTQEDAEGKPLDTVFKIVNEETRRTVENPAIRALREGLVVGLANHTALIAKDGKERPIDDSAAPIRNAKGEIAGVVLVFRDVTERRKAEEALRLSEERFRLLVEGTADYAIFMLDPTGHIISWNAGAEQIKGYRAEEIVGQHFSRFYPNEDVQAGKPERELKIAATEGKYGEEGWRVRKDGSLFWANVVITALRDEAGNLRGFSKITRDLTEHKRYEDSLRQSEERFRLLVTGVKDYAIFMLDPQGRVASWNAGAEQIKGYRAEEIVGQHFSRFYPNEDVQAGKPERELKIAATEGRYEEEGWRVRKDGSLFWANVLITALRDKTGNLKGFSKITRDLTLHKLAEERLEAFASKLQRSNRELEQFASVASHDLQEPLRKIQAFGDRLLTRCGESLDEQGREYLERIQTSAARMRTLIEDLLAFSRLTSKAQPFTPVNLTTIAQEVVSDLEERIQQTGGQVKVGHLPGVEADSLQMRQLFQNLIGNGLKFHRPDVPPVVQVTGRLLVSERRHFNWQGQNGSVCQLMVQDNGIGFEETYLDRIFEVFQRLHGRQEYEGSGIGLAICRKIVERHRGTITAHSMPGQGATFIVTLPTRQPKESGHNGETSEAGHDSDGR